MTIRINKFGRLACLCLHQDIHYSFIIDKLIALHVLKNTLDPLREDQNNTAGKAIVICIEKYSILPLQFHLINQSKFYCFFRRKTKHVKENILRPKKR